MRHPKWYCVVWAGLIFALGGVIVFLSPPPPPTYAEQRAQDSTFVAQIKQCCAKQGWVWADDTHLRDVARRVYERSSP